MFKIRDKIKSVTGKAESVMQRGMEIAHTSIKSEGMTALTGQARQLRSDVIDKLTPVIIRIISEEDNLEKAVDLFFSYVPWHIRIIFGKKKAKKLLLRARELYLSNCGDPLLVTRVDELIQQEIVGGNTELFCGHCGEAFGNDASKCGHCGHDIQQGQA